MNPTPRWMRLRSWLAGIAFRLAGILDPVYDVWLDDAPPRLRRAGRPVPRRHPGDREVVKLAAALAVLVLAAVAWYYRHPAAPPDDDDGWAVGV